MKKILLAVSTAIVLVSCGGSGNNSSALANEVCDCYKKANAMDAADPKRIDAQNDCVKKQQEAWNKLKDDAKKSDEFNKTIGECGKQEIQKSLNK